MMCRKQADSTDYPLRYCSTVRTPYKHVQGRTRCCIPCQTAKVHRHNKAPIGTFDVPGARFHHVLINLVGLLSPS